jgi:prenyltransferase/squalene oxidase-like repeat protein
VPVDPVGGVPSRQGLVLSALGSVGRTDAQAAEWLEKRECPDGGWEFRRTDPSAPCSATAQVTGYALQGLAAVGRRVPDDAIPALRRLQDPDGGFWSFPRNTDSAATAFALQGLIAAGEDPNSDRWRRGTGANATTPFGALARCTTPPGGFSLFPGGAPEVALTARVAVAAAGQPLPLNPTVSTDSGDSEAGQDSTTASPPSGDSFSVLPLIGLMVLAAAVVGAVYAYRRKQQAL